VKISIVVPAFNEEKFIARSLRKIKAATDAFASLGWESELIVCDNNSTDRTAEKARAAEAMVVFEPINQISRARNQGASAATGDWLVFVDADSYPSRELFADLAVVEVKKGSVLNIDTEWQQATSARAAQVASRKSGCDPSLDESLGRGGTAGERRGESAWDGGGGIEAARVDGGRPKGSAERRRKEGAHHAAVAGGDDNDAELDRGGVADGELDTRVEFTVQAAAEDFEVR